MQLRLVLFTRYPTAGQAKTRLIPALGADGAAELHKRLAERTVRTLRESGLPLELSTTGASAKRFAAWLGKDLAHKAQSGDNLGDRLAHASDPAPVIIVGSDCPGLSAHHIAKAQAALRTAQVVIGPAEDGGYWLIGIATRCDFLFRDMEWGTGNVLAETLRRLADRAIEPAMLETLADCDRPEDLARWPDLTR